ncbi:MAG: hypothetical protein ACJ739_04665 [Acidimicrobiales bacterium]
MQIIEGTTSDPEALRAAGDAWQEEVRPGAIGFLGVTAGAAPDGRAFTLVRFQDEASARANSERPEQGAWFEKHLAGGYDGPPTFTESSDVIEFMGGGSDDAGFVQVMKINGVDRQKLEALDSVFEKFAGERPDILGGLRAWTGSDSCVDVMYFTSQEEARKGEAADVPEELQKAMADFGAMAQVDFIDLPDPELR